MNSRDLWKSTVNVWITTYCVSKNYWEQILNTLTTEKINYYLWLKIPKYLITEAWRALNLTRKYIQKILELSLGLTQFQPLPNQHTFSWPLGKVPFPLPSLAHCRSPHYIHCRHHTHGLAVFLPTFPYHTGAAFLQTQREESQDESVGEDCSGCFHVKISIEQGGKHREESKYHPNASERKDRNNKYKYCLFKYLITLRNSNIRTIMLAVFYSKTLRLRHLE